MDSLGFNKIAYYCVATHLGGAERSMLDLISNVEATSVGWYRPWVIAPSGEGPFVDRLRERDIPITVLPMPRGFFEMSRARPVRSLLRGAVAWPAVRVYLKKLESVVREEAPVLVHTTGIKCHALSTRLGKFVPVLWHLRDVLGSGPARAALRRLRERTNIHVVANSYATAMAFDPSVESPTVVYNGIDLRSFTPGRDAIFRDMLEVPDHVPVVGIVGVLQRGKGVMDFVEMAAMLRREGVECRFVIVGDEIYDTGRDRGFRAELEARVVELGLEGVVKFTGFLQDTLRVMRGLDVLVSASTTPESFGRGVVEAMACGVPVVASALGGTLEILEDRQTGRLFGPGDPQAMAAAVRSVLEDVQSRERMIASARDRVEARFTMTNYVAGIVRAYDRILGIG